LESSGISSLSNAKNNSLPVSNSATTFELRCGGSNKTEDETIPLAFVPLKKDTSIDINKMSDQFKKHMI